MLVSGGNASKRLIVSLRALATTPKAGKAGTGGYIPNLDVPSTIDPSPDIQNILPAAHAQNSTTNLVTRLGELIPNYGQKEILPVPIGHALLQPNHPLPTFLVRLIFPNRTHPFAEDMVV